MSHKGKLWSHVQFKESGEIQHPEEYHEEDLPGYGDDVEDKNIARVSVKFGRTIDLGKWKSARVDVGVELPAHVSELNEAYEAAEQFVGARYVKLVNEVATNGKLGTKNSGSGIADDDTDRDGNDDGITY